MPSELLDVSEEANRRRATPFLRRLQIRNFKSIVGCDLALKPLTILVGRNGAGKSNCLDALRFVMEGLQTSLDHAVKSRGGIEEVRRRSTGHPHNFSIWLEMDLANGSPASYGFEIGARPQGGFVVKREALKSSRGSFSVEEGRIVHPSKEIMPPALPDRLYLVNASGLPQFRPVYDALLNMGFYNLNPEAMKKPQSPEAGELLHRDGSNIASVVAKLDQEKPDIMARIQAYLAKIVPDIASVIRVPVGSWETLEFRQEVKGSKHPWKFNAFSMSDGTLRAFGSLVAVTQIADREIPVSLVGIEEPETALHAAAVGALMDALREAACHTQILVTTHSPDLLDQIDFRAEALLAVQCLQGTTEIGPVDEASRHAIENHLYSPGELLRMDQLQVDPKTLARIVQPDFDFTEAVP